MASVLVSLAEWAGSRPFRLCGLDVQFRKPLFVTREYVLETFEEGDGVIASILGGGVLHTRIAFAAALGENETTGVGEAVDDFIPLPSPAVFEFPPTSSSYVACVEVPSQVYRPERTGLAANLSCFQLGESQLPFAQLSALLWSSYFVGMVVPGQQALFSELSFEFSDTVDGTDGFVARDIEARFDRRYNRVKLKGIGSGVVSFKISAFVRPPPPEFPSFAISKAFAAGPSWTGKSVFVSGASRGFGSVLAAALALRGAAVTANFLRSKADAEMILQQMREAGGDFTLTKGDVGNAEDCARMAGEVSRDHRRLHLLIHNAFPAIQAHTFIEQGHEEFLRFVGRALGYVSTLSEAFLPMMAEGGTVVVISSVYVTTPRPLFSHYVTAKAAIEGLVRVLALEHPSLRFIIARAPRMLTEQTNVPFQTEKLASTLDVAAALLAKLEQEELELGVHELAL